MKTYGWYVTGYYADDVELPKTPRAMALKVWCGTEAIRDLEEKVFNERADIGIVSVQHVDNG